MQIRTLTLLILVMPLFGFAVDSRKVKLHNNAKAMKEEVLGRIPVERSIETTKEVMEKSGFRCEMRWNDAFAEFDEKGNQTTHEEMDFLYCDREKTAFPYVCTRRWQVAIVHKRRAVTDVFVSVGLICP